MAKIKKTLGGDRLGAGNKMKITMHGFGRSNHNISRTFKTDQAAGTVVPCFVDVATNGTDYYLRIDSKIRTLPTNGPIFGRFKHQVDVFSIPIRLYNAQLHNNALNIGRKISSVKFPLVSYIVQKVPAGSGNLQQVAQDSLTAYLGLRGFGTKDASLDGQTVKRNFPAMFELAYWDIIKNYYTNKQEEVGYYITGSIAANEPSDYARQRLTAIVQIEISETGGTSGTQKLSPENDFALNRVLQVTYNPNATDIQPENKNLRFYFGDNQITEQQFRNLKILNPNAPSNENQYITINQLLQENTEFSIRSGQTGASGQIGYPELINQYYWEIYTEDRTQILDWDKTGENAPFTPPITQNQPYEGIELKSYPLENIDEMRERILAAPKTAPFNVTAQNLAPYTATSGTVNTGNTEEIVGNACYFSQGGLALKTYMSDRFNNWMNTEWIDGENGINEITAVEVVDGKITMDSLILQKKIYDMMNRVALGDGTYTDWQEVVYGQRVVRIVESPVYEGGYSSEIVFDEVVSTSDATTSNGEDSPLGTLAGRGAERNKKGDDTMIHVHIAEPSILMVLESITPLIDYSQGNKWYMNLRTLDDLHKPELDQIGFQDLITEEIAAFDTLVTGNDEITTFSAGKQPSWMEYMTNVNESYGSFAAGNELEWMTLNRNYEQDEETGRIKDLTTYIDPTKFNIAFADAKLSAKNFWVQIAIGCTARRVMSAKQIPSL